MAFPRHCLVAWTRAEKSKFVWLLAKRAHAIHNRGHETNTAWRGSRFWALDSSQFWFIHSFIYGWGRISGGYYSRCSLLLMLRLGHFHCCLNSLFILWLKHIPVSLECPGPFSVCLPGTNILQQRTNEWKKPKNDWTKFLNDVLLDLFLSLAISSSRSTISSHACMHQEFHPKKKMVYSIRLSQQQQHKKQICSTSKNFKILI